MAYGTAYGQRSMLYGKGGRERRKDVTFYGKIGRERFFRIGGAEGKGDLLGGAQPKTKTVGRHPQQPKYEKHTKDEK